MDLDSLLINLEGVRDDEAEALALKLYREHCGISGPYGVCATHDGHEVRFWESRFRHAFYSPTNYRLSSQKQILDKRRVARVRWIHEVIQGNFVNSDCWLVEQNGMLKRLYRAVPKGYVIWLEVYREDYLTFSTAYVATPNQLHGYTRGAKRLWKYGQNKTP